ncbi:MAG: hypothetical protein AB1716_17355 [Planctomycetota bacterium]
MSRLFREYNRTLILVFMSLLLVAFLIPNTIQGCGGRDPTLKQKIGEAFGRTITVRDVRQADADVRLISSLFGFQLPEEQRFQYYLLMEEAERMGIRVPRSEAQAYLTESGASEEALQSLQRQTGRSYDQIFDVLARWLAVERVLALQTAGLVDSLPRREAEYRDNRQEAAAKLSVIDDRAFVHKVPEPTEEQIQAFFEATKDRASAHTDTEFVYGYKLPNRVQVEYVTVDPNQMRDRIHVTAAQAKKWMEDNQSRYMKPNPLATQPASELPQVPMTYDEARDRVRADYRAARALEEAQRLVTDLYNAAHRPWVPTGRDAEGFSNPPAEPASLAQLKERMGSDYPIEHHVLDLQGEEALKRVPGFGKAALLLGREQLTAAQLAVRVKGLLPKDPADGKPVLNVGEPSPIVFIYDTDPLTRRPIARQAFVFRVLSIAPSAPPELAEVRAQLIEDWKMIEAHTLAQKYAEDLAARARAIGLEQAVEEAKELKEIFAAAAPAATQPTSAPGDAPEAGAEYLRQLKPIQPSRLMRESPFVAGIGLAGDIPKRVFALAETPTEADAPHRATAIPLAGRKRWVVAELLEIKPIYQDDFQKEFAQAAGRMFQERQEFERAWLRSENIESRTKFVSELRRAPQE